MYDKHRPSTLSGSRETQKVATMAGSSSVTVKTASLSVIQPLSILAVQTQDNTKDLSLNICLIIETPAHSHYQSVTQGHAFHREHER